jgi:putative addiction module component (TIGR02574 family)
MTKNGRDLLERALRLPMAERARLAQEIYDSLDEEHGGEVEVDPEYRKELARRARDEPKPGERWATPEEAVARLRRELDKPRRKSKKRERRA